MTTVGQLLLLALPRTCECGHRPFDHHGFALGCDGCGCLHYTEAAR